MSLHTWRSQLPSRPHFHVENDTQGVLVHSQGSSQIAQHVALDPLCAAGVGITRRACCPSTVRGPVDYSHGRLKRISTACRARRSGVHSFAIAHSQ